jgi:hypothetical protein
MVSANTARPDGTSTVMPMDIEIKTDQSKTDELATINYEVLMQAVERINMRMYIQGYLKMAFAFAVSSQSAWYLVVERSEPLKKPKMWIDRIAHSDVNKLWMYLTKIAEQQPNFFFSDDGVKICSSLQKLGIVPYGCQVRALAELQSVVYGITVPHEYIPGNGNTFVGVAIGGKDTTYAMKIISNDEIYETKSKALQKIATKAGPFMLWPLCPQGLIML